MMDANNASFKTELCVTINKYDKTNLSYLKYVSNISVSDRKKT